MEQVLNVNRLRPGEYLACPDLSGTIYHNAHACDSIRIVEHIRPVSRRVVPLLCHGGCITWSEVVEHIFSTGHHAGNMCHNSISPGREIIMAERTGCLHIRSMVTAEAVDIGVSGQRRPSVAYPYCIHRIEKCLFTGGSISRWWR